jgi:hypothetical protein
MTMLHAMADDAPPPYVASASLCRWRIHAVPPAPDRLVLEMRFDAMVGGVGYELCPPAPVTFAQAAIVARQLRDLGFALSAGQG